MYEKTPASGSCALCTNTFTAVGLILNRIFNEKAANTFFEIIVSNAAAFTPSSSSSPPSSSSSLSSSYCSVHHP